MLYLVHTKKLRCRKCIAGSSIFGARSGKLGLLDNLFNRYLIQTCAKLRIEDA